MINTVPYETLGHNKFGWLDARHHFSFGGYHNPERVHFGALRVINDDIVKAGAGFDTHPHSDMEIITFVRKGAITHRDSQGNLGRTEAGDVQVMSAGTGIHHSEFNRESVDTTLFQIWIIPNKRGVTPRWDARTLSRDFATDTLPLLVSGRTEDEGKGALFIHQDAAVYGGRVKKDTTINQPIKYQAYVLVSDGEIEIDGVLLKQGDGAEVTDTHLARIKALSDAEIVVIDVPDLD